MNYDPRELILNDETIPIIRQITDGMPGGFFLYRADGDEEFLHVSAGMLRIFGCDTEEQFRALTHNSFRGMVHPDDLDAVEDSINDQIHDSEYGLDYVEYRIIRADGSIRWITDFGHFVHTDAYGNVFYVFIEDITTQHMQAEADRHMQEVIRGLSVGYASVYLVDYKRRSMTAYRLNNDVSRRIITGGVGSRVNYDAAMARFRKEYVVPENRENFRLEADLDYLRKRLQYESSYSIIFRRVDPQGRIDNVEMVAARVDTPDGAVIGFRVVNGEVANIRAEMQNRARDAHVQMVRRHFLAQLDREIDALDRQLTALNEAAGQTGQGGAITEELHRMQHTASRLRSLTNVSGPNTRDYNRAAESVTVRWTHGAFVGKRILFAEDNELTRELTELILTDAGFAVESVPDGQALVETFRNAPEGHFDLILSDVQMPRMDGFAAAAAVRRCGDYGKKIPIVSFSTIVTPESMSGAVAAGMTTRVSKPLDIVEFLSTVAPYLGEGMAPPR